MATDYTASANCIGAWLFKEGTGTTVADLSGNGGTGLNVPAWSSTVPTGYANYSANFNGTSDKITLNNDVLHIQKPLSIVAWVKVPSTSTAYDILGGNNDQSYFHFFIDSANKLHAIKRNAVDIGQSTGTVGTSFAHVAWTYDSSGNYVFYINGSASGSGTNSVTFTYQYGTFLGGQDRSSQFFSGLMTEVAMFDVALTSTQISEIYTSGLDGSVGGGSPASQFMTTNSRMW